MSTPTNTVRTVGVIGAGTMGSGIAQVAAQHGIEVILYDVANEFLDRALIRIRTHLESARQKGKVSDAEVEAVEAHLNTVTDLDTVAQADLVIEAIPEDLALKRELFARLDSLAPEQTVLASNTSSLSITALGAATRRARRVAGLHFFNPVPLMKLVEVVAGPRTAETTLVLLEAFATALDKTPVRCKDTPGFIVNRVARPFYGEALKLLGEAGLNGLNPAFIDTVVKDAGGFRMGPFELMDLIGLDVNLAVTRSVYEATFHEPRYRPHPIQQRMVDAGLLGRKTGEGFYPYD